MTNEDMVGSKYENISFEKENTPNDSGITIKEITMRQLQRCCLEGSKEMQRGGTIQKFISGKWVEVEVPNQREVFFNSVNMLHIILCSKLRKYEKILEEIQEMDRIIYKEEKDKKKQYLAIVNGKNVINSNEKIDKINDSLELTRVGTSKNKLSLLMLLLSKENYFEEAAAQN